MQDASGTITVGSGEVAKRLGRVEPQGSGAPISLRWVWSDTSDPVLDELCECFAEGDVLPDDKRAYYFAEIRHSVRQKRHEIGAAQ